ncbi:MAG TPA: choice-of-anchor tandem repeat GloVer-containing protein [Candidatus Saccharimonadales bacterium]|nr:choice-of-anchor tandem repeat GloVer-containing protein [Candidatus Saccharimonadales bacterium]
MRLLPLAVCALALSGPIKAGVVSQGVYSVYSFTGTSNGAAPRASLIQASDGYYYGTTSAGGADGGGTIFRLSTNGAFSSLFSFSGTNGSSPSAALVQAADGNLYGTTEYGGAYSSGTVFRISTNGVFASVYSFYSVTGYYPASSLVQASDGYLYGTTEDGGVDGEGTIFRISTSGVFTSLYSFTGTSGAYPVAALIQGSDGNLYGTAVNGGAYGSGTVFQFGTNGSMVTLHSFTGNDGAYPSGSLLQAGNGNLYGTTQNGGTNGSGTVFQISTSGAFTSLYYFTGANDGGFPGAGMIQAGNGNLYGTTVNGGIGGNGTIFQITTNGALTSLYSFTGGSDGAYPVASLLQASNGQLYGTTSSGGVSGTSSGTVFVVDTLQVTPRNFGFSFPAGGPIPATNLTLSLLNLGNGSLNWSLASASSLFSISASNGVVASGATVPLTVSFSPAAAASLPPGFYPGTFDFTNLSDGAVQSIQVTLQVLLSPLASFAGSDGASPYSPLLQASDGSFYGTTATGGPHGFGTAFRMSTNGSVVTLYSFTGGNDGGSLGGNQAGPAAGLIQTSDGYLYGTTQYGGSNGYGTIFRMSTNGSLTTLYSFTGGYDGGNSTAGLIEGRDGNLYGTTAGGDYFGTLFRITTSGAFTVIYSFTGGDDGAWPEAPLIQTRDGYFYGTASAGGINGVGTVFRADVNGGFTSLFSFNDTDGSTPAAPLLRGTDGYLYGTTTFGKDRSAGGTVFRISTNGVFKALYLFPVAGSLYYGQSYPSGGYPYAGLIQASDGNLYGTTENGGFDSAGTVFRISTNGAFASLFSFNYGVDGSYPYTSLIQAGDGNLYGTASTGGLNGYGTVFKISTNGEFTPLHSFFFSGLSDPLGPLQSGGGNLYGTTEYGGAFGQGTVFQVGANGSLTTLYSFTAGGVEGSAPFGSTIQGRDGNLYGTTDQGGTYGEGTVFRISTNGAFTSLFSFTGANGSLPQAALLQASDGNLYGTTLGGGAYSQWHRLSDLHQWDLHVALFVLLRDGL